MALSVSSDADQLNSRRWWGLAVICLAQLIVMLDTTIVNIALPAAQHDTGLSDANRQWVITGYTLAFGGLLLLGGRLGDLMGRRRAFVVAMCGFVAASAVGGAATGGGFLIGARIAQGTFAALLMPTILALLTTSFTEPRERAKAFGIFSSIASAGGALGLVGGGVITEYLDWRWCFYVNVPLGVVVVAGAVLLPELTAHRGARIDVPGALLSFTGMTLLVYGFSEAASTGWADPRVAGCLGAAVVVLAGFVWLQARVRHPLLPLRVLTDRNRAGAFLAIGLTMMGLFGLMFILTYQLQEVMRFSALQTGLAILPATVGTVLVATQVTPRLMPVLPVRLLVVPGMLLAALGLLNLGRIAPDSSYTTTLLPTQVLVGIGLGLVMSPCINVATSNVAPATIGVVSAFVSTSQQIGGSIGVALLNAIAITVTSNAVAAAGPRADTAYATADGFAVAGVSAAAIVAVGAALAGALINADLRKPRAADPQPGREAKEALAT